VNSNAPANIIQNIATSRNGYATLFQGDLPETPCFPQLDGPLLEIHKQLKHKMDPRGIFNPGRIYSGL
jgi:glycolate oxidase FAD binding subunit